MSAPALFPPSFKAFEHSFCSDTMDQMSLNISVRQPPLQPDQVRLKVRGAAIDPVDLTAIAGKSDAGAPTPSMAHPAHCGFDLSGTVVEVGDDISDSLGLRVDDSVLAMAPFDRAGAFGEYVCMDADLVVHKPAAVDFNEAAALPMTELKSLQALVTYGELKAGERLLIFGGSSGVTSIAEQMAKTIGAHVAGVCCERTGELLTMLGADEIIDKADKWADEVAEHSVDLVVDYGEDPSAWTTGAQRVLKPGTGRFVTTFAALEPTKSTTGASAKSFLVQPNRKDLATIVGMVERGELLPVVDSIYQFEQVLAALDAQAAGCARGKIILHTTGPS